MIEYINYYYIYNKILFSNKRVIIDIWRNIVWINFKIVMVYKEFSVREVCVFYVKIYK